MGAQWKQKGKLENSAKRGSVISKAVKEIIVAAKAGDPDPANNSRLRAAVESAKKQSVPRENIERAIKKGAGLLEPVNYELITFEGFAPHKVPLIIECLTDNRNRTNADIKTIFRKAGSLASVAFLFNHVGLVEAETPDKSVDIEEVAIEVGAQEVEKTDDGARFICELKDLIGVTKALEDRKWKITASEFTYIAKESIDVSEEARKEIGEFLNEIDDSDDVQRIFTAMK